MTLPFALWSALASVLYGAARVPTPVVSLPVGETKMPYFSLMRHVLSVGDFEVPGSHASGSVGASITGVSVLTVSRRVSSVMIASDRSARRSALASSVGLTLSIDASMSTVEASSGAPPPLPPVPELPPLSIIDAPDAPAAPLDPPIPEGGHVADSSQLVSVGPQAIDVVVATIPPLAASH